MSEISGVKYVLEEDEELRIEVEIDEKETFEIELLKGNAEIFGWELRKDTKHRFANGSKFALFTFQGCTLMIYGKSNVVPVKSQDTPMIMSLQVHATLEELRKLADERSKTDETVKGPVTLVVGPTDSGKSTLTKTLVNYAVRMGRRPIYMDLDVGQGSISVPGTLGATIVTEQVDVMHGFDSCPAPLVYNFGHKAPGHNLPLYNNYITRMAEVVKDQQKHNPKCQSSGIIVNSCGWVKGQGYSHLLHIAQSLEVDLIVVMDEQRLYCDLQRDMPNFVKVIWLPRSSGVVSRSQPLRIASRTQKIREYFFGTINSTLEPASFEVKFSELENRIYKVGSVFFQQSNDERILFKLTNIQPSSKELVNHLLALSFATNSDDLTDSNVAGFVCVTKVDMDAETITVLSPQPEPLPEKCLFIFSDIQFNIH